MRCHGKIFSAMVLAGLLFPHGVQALTMEPPLPNSCKEAKIALDPQTKVNLYTRCLDGDDQSGIRLEKYQREEMHFNRANALFELRRYAEALVDYDRFIANQYGGHVWALHQRGLTHRAMGQRQLALADFNQALEIGRASCRERV